MIGYCIPTKIGLIQKVKDLLIYFHKDRLVTNKQRDKPNIDYFKKLKTVGCNYNYTKSLL